MFKVITEAQASELVKRTRKASGENLKVAEAIKTALKDSKGQKLSASVKDLYNVEAMPIANLYRLRKITGNENIHATGKSTNENGLPMFSGIVCW